MPPPKLRDKKYLREHLTNAYENPDPSGERDRSPDRGRSSPRSHRRQLTPPASPGYIPSPPYAPMSAASYYDIPSPPYAPMSESYYDIPSPSYAPVSASSSSYYDIPSPPYAPPAADDEVKRIRFYDDNVGHITAVNREFGDMIEGILVHQIPLMNCMTGDMVTMLRDYENYIQECGGWDLDGEDSDLNGVLAVYGKIANAHEEISQALSIQDFDDLQAWAAELPDNPGRRFRGKVFFDWDQVLNHIEGMYVHPTIWQVRAQKNVEPSGYLKLCMGSKARMLKVKQTISYLFAHDIEVNIVTNNGSCRNGDADAVFGYISAALDPRIQVHCCKTYPEKAACIRARDITQGVAFGKSKKSKKRHHGVLMFTNMSRV